MNISADKLSSWETKYNETQNTENKTLVIETDNLSQDQGTPTRM